MKETIPTSAVIVFLYKIEEMMLKGKYYKAGAACRMFREEIEKA